MLLKELYKNIDYVINADGTDDFFPPDDFNRLTASELVKFVRTIIDEESDNNVLRMPMRDYLLTYVVPSTLVPADTHPYSVPDDFMRLEAATCSIGGNPTFAAEIVNVSEAESRRSNLMKPPIEVNYITYVYGDKIYTLPNNGTWLFHYIKIPDDPFLDYYIDSNSVLTFLDAGADLSAINSGTYRDGSNMNTVSDTSDTVELDIPEEYHTRFMEHLFERLGLKDRDQINLQYNMANEQLNKSTN